ncbi:MAG: DUF4296 domain-containing protein [Bacteroidota bacterium]
MVKLKYRCWLAALWLLVACAEPNAGPTPAEVQKLAPILAELHLLEALINELPLSLRDSMRVEWYQNVLSDQQMTLAELDSLSWLMRSEPEWLESTYREVQEELARRSAESGTNN